MFENLDVAAAFAKSSTAHPDSGRQHDGASTPPASAFGKPHDGPDDDEEQTAATQGPDSKRAAWSDFLGRFAKLTQADEPNSPARLTDDDEDGHDARGRYAHDFWLGELDWAGYMVGQEDTVDPESESFFSEVASFATGSIVVAESLMSDTRDKLNAPFVWEPGRNLSLPPGNSERTKRCPGSPRNVKIMYFDTGGGHRSAAQSVEAALLQLYGARVNVELVEAAAKLPAPWCYATEIYAWLGKHPSIYEKLWRADDNVSDFRKSSLYQNMRWNCNKHIKAWVSDAVHNGADLFLSVHPFCNHLLGDVLESGVGSSSRPMVPWATIVTDLGAAHVSWFDPRANALFVPTEDLRARARELKLSDSIIHVCGLPVRRGFWNPLELSKAESRLRLGLAAEGVDSEDLLVVLLMGGGEGFGHLEDVAVALGELLARNASAKLVVACGRNEELRCKLANHAWPESSLPPEILGFVTNVDEYMAASDVLVTKAGPGSIAEAAIRGLPCMLISFLPGQEEGNVTFVTSNGAGEYVPDSDPEQVAKRLAEWLGDRELLRQMSECAQSLGRPNATLHIAEELGKLLFDDTEAVTEYQAVGGGASVAVTEARS